MDINTFKVDEGNIKRIQDVVNRRIIGVMSHGRSIEELENRIEEYRNYDICWASFNLYSIMQDFILSKINQKLNIVLECADGRTRKYEETIRMPTIEKYLEQHTLILTTWRLMGTQYQNLGIDDFYKKYKDKLLLVDTYLGRLNVPNSLALLLCSIAIGKPKKIVIFGLDGFSNEDPTKEFETYYKPELAKERRITMLGKLEYTLKSTTIDFERIFNSVLGFYCKQCRVPIPEIINCSPNSIFTNFPITNYNEVHKWIFQ